MNTFRGSTVAARHELNLYTTIGGDESSRVRAEELIAKEMKMPIAMAILSLALLMWAEGASAQDPPKTYSVSVSVHKTLEQLKLNDADVKEILDKASKMLQKSPGHVDACNVSFTLKGSVGTFSDPPTAIVNRDNIDTVMNFNVDGADFHIKVVKGIDFCRPGVDTPQAGCAFSPPHFRSVIVIHPDIHRGPDHLLWAHEFGHLTGLAHRESVEETGAPDDKSALMVRCPLKTQFPAPETDDTQVQVSPDECRHLLAGPGHRSPGPFKNPPVCR